MVQISRGEFLYGRPPLLSQRGRPSISIFSLERLLFRKIMSSPLAVPKIVCSLFTSHNFDRCANSHSLHRPQGAVVFLAIPIRQSGQGCKASQHFRLSIIATQFRNLPLAICNLQLIYTVSYNTSSDESEEGISTTNPLCFSSLPDATKLSPSLSRVTL